MGITINSVLVYGYLVTDGTGLRLRVSADDVERLGLVPGQQVRLEGPGREPATFLLTAAEGAPPLVWLWLQPLASRVAG